MVTLQLDGEPEVDAVALASVPQWSELLRQLLRGMYHGLNGGLSSAEASVHLALDDGDMTPRAAADLRQALAVVERLVVALEPLTARSAGAAPEPVALDQLVASLRPTLDLQLDAIGTEFVFSPPDPPPVRAPWGELRDGLLILLSRSARAARAAGARRVDLVAESEGERLCLRASYPDARGGTGDQVATGTLRVPLF